MPKVSICIPAYNHEKYIEIAVNSILNQTYTDYEIIIVDDKSKDKTWEIIQKYDYPNIRCYCNKENKGMVGNWNEVVSYAEGEYIKLLGGDDILLPTCLEEEVRALDENPNVSMVISDSLIINSSEEIKGKIERFYKEGIKEGKKLARKSIRYKNYFGNGANALFRKKSFDKWNGFDERVPVIPDFDMWIKLAYLGDVYYIKKSLSKFRIHEEATTRDVMTSKKDSFFKAHIDMINQHKELGIIHISHIDLVMHKFCIRVRSFMVDKYLKYEKYLKVKKS